MIVETIIASVTAITIVGTWLGLRFAEKTLHPEEERSKKRKAAIEVVRHAITNGTSMGARDQLRALLITEPESLPDDVRERAVVWLRQQHGISIPLKLDAKEPPR